MKRMLCLAVVLGSLLPLWFSDSLLAADPAVPLGPNAIVATPDGARLLVACTDAKQVLLIEAAGGKLVAKVAVPAEPTGIALTRDGKKAYVTCAAPQSAVCVIEVPAMKIVTTLPAGHTAIGPTLTPDETRLYVCNRFNNQVAVLDLKAGKTVATIPMTREPHGAVVTPDGKTAYVYNHLPLDRSDGYDVAALVVAIDTATQKTSTIRLLNGSTGLRGMCVSPDGKYVYVTHILARYQMPTTQLERGWMNTNALSIIDAAAKKLINTVLLDDVDLGAANPWGVACTADSQTVCVAHAGTHELSVIDIAGVMKKLASIPADAKAAAEKAAAEKDKKIDRGIYASTTLADVPNDLAFLVDLRRRIKLDCNGPRGVAIIGNKAYVTGHYSDSLTVLDLTQKPERPQSMALGPKIEPSVVRRGEMLFNDARVCFQHWQSCASCHPDARVDALNWDLMNDGLGNPKNNKSMLLVHKTPPSMWAGVRPTGEDAVRSGLTHILFTVQEPDVPAAMDEYLKALQPVPSPHLVNGQLSAAAKRGKDVFFNEEVGCAKCHPEPLYTDLRMHDVGSEGPYDRRSTFDTPTLIECWRTAPYMHDGHYLTLKELFTKGKHGAKGGNLDKLTPQQIDDLVEFVLSL